MAKFGIEARAVLFREIKFREMNLSNKWIVRMEFSTVSFVEVLETHHVFAELEHYIDKPDVPFIFRRIKFMNVNLQSVNFML